MTLEDIKRAGEQWVFDKDSRASISFMLFGNQHKGELSKEKVEGGHSFFPYLEVNYL